MVYQAVLLDCSSGHPVKKVVNSTYVMHGSGKGSTAEKPVFSYSPGSKYSAHGRFAVTKVHGTKLKRSFKLKDIDLSNRTAWTRGLMIHSSRWVDLNCWRKYIPLHESSCQGCITGSSRGMNYLEKLINSLEKPLLLWPFTSEKKWKSRSGGATEHRNTGFTNKIREKKERESANSNWNYKRDPGGGEGWLVRLEPTTFRTTIRSWILAMCLFINNIKECFGSLGSTMGQHRFSLSLHSAFFSGNANIQKKQLKLQCLGGWL